VKPGDLLLFYVYLPDTGQRAVRTVRVADGTGVPKLP
jgi:hypothetical protein